MKRGEITGAKHLARCPAQGEGSGKVAPAAGVPTDPLTYFVRTWMLSNHLMGHK